MQWTKHPPTLNGYYFHAENLADWDLAQIRRVQKVEDCTGIRCEVYIDGTWINVHDNVFSTSLWWGPLPVPMRPTEEVLKMIKRP